MSYREDVTAVLLRPQICEAKLKVVSVFASLQNFTFIFAVPQRANFYRL
jgi:hypothetical protein